MIGITFGVTAKGALEVIRGPDVPLGVQHDEFHKINTGDLPEGYVEVRLIEYEDYATRKTRGVDRAAQKRREQGYLVDIDGESYPLDVYAARLEWRANDAAARAKAVSEGKPYISPSEIPSKPSDVKSVKKTSPATKDA